MAFAGRSGRAGAGINPGQHTVPEGAMTNFAHFHFAAPGWLWLALLGPLALALLFRYATTARREELRRMVTPHFAEQLTASHSPARRWLKNVLLLVVIALAGVALARPQW